MGKVKNKTKTRAAAETPSRGRPRRAAKQPERFRKEQQQDSDEDETSGDMLAALQAQVLALQHQQNNLQKQLQTAKVHEKASTDTAGIPDRDQAGSSRGKKKRTAQPAPPVESSDEEEEDEDDEMTAPPLKVPRAHASAGQTQQKILGAALQAMLQEEPNMDQGEDMMADYLVLGALLAPKIRDNIWAGKYVELSSLGDSKEQSVSVALNSTDSLISLTPSKAQPPGNFYEWLRLFSTYTAVYVEKFPAQAAALMTYQIRIMDMQRSYGGLVWRNYDEKFRRLRAKMPGMSWQVINWQIALPCINVAPGAGSGAGKGQGPGQAKAGYDRTPRGHCFKFNGKGCSAKPCKFKHICGSCGGTHSRLKCTDKHRPADTSKNTGSE
jgi:hypothetical protein